MRADARADAGGKEIGPPQQAAASTGYTTTGDVADLVRRIGSGERQAEEELVDRFSRGLSIMLRGLAGDRSLAEDLHQETFRVVLAKARQGAIREPEKLLGFLRATARNLLIAERRKAGKRGESGGASDAPRPVEAPQLNRLLRSEKASLVRRLLGELRFPRDREVLVRFYLAGATKEEICTDLAIEPKRFKKVLFLARNRMRELWEHTEKRRQLLAGGAA